MSNKEVRILYGLEHDDLLDEIIIRKIEDNMKEIKDASGTRFKSDVARYSSLFDGLLTSNKYDLVVTHLGLNSNDNFWGSINHCTEIRELSMHYKPRIVAESGSYPYENDIIMKYFDHYMKSMSIMKDLVTLLKKYDFVPKDFYLREMDLF